MLAFPLFVLQEKYVVKIQTQHTCIACMQMEHYERSVTGREAHPSLTIQNLAMSNMLWPQLQVRKFCWFLAWRCQERQARVGVPADHNLLGHHVLQRLVSQGMHDNVVYFAGSAMTPGNGHDLSFLSGLIVAKKLGAAYPFAHSPAAAADFERLRGLMGIKLP